MENYGCKVDDYETKAKNLNMGFSSKCGLVTRTVTWGLIENKKHFKTPAVKLKLRTLLSKIEPLNHQLINPMERATMAQANQFLNRNRSNN